MIFFFVQLLKSSRFVGFFFFFLNCSRDQAQRQKIFYVLSDKDSRIVCLFDLCCSRNIHRFSCNWVQINVSQQQDICVILFFYWRKLFDLFDLIKQTYWTEIICLHEFCKYVLKFYITLGKQSDDSLCKVFFGWKYFVKICNNKK